jgi:hypothetical protein
MKNLSITLPEISLPNINKKAINDFLEEYAVTLIIGALATISIITWISFYQNGLGLSYNDARSHLNIGRRVVEGLKPGFAQIGSVWLPLTHVLMIPTIWNDFMWHSGLSGALMSMISFVATGVLVYQFLKKLGASMLARIFGVLLFAANLNILYLQSTAMTELLLIATMTAGSYYLMLWAKDQNLVDIIKSSFFIMLSTLIRYDGWFLIFFTTLIVAFEVFRKKGYRAMEGMVIMFTTLGGLGIFLWVMWNALIFKDPFFFAFGEFSAHAQQEQLEAAGELATKGNLLLSIKVYLYALMYNSYAFISALGFLGGIALMINKKISTSIKIASLALVAPLIFNILALVLGHSVLFIQGISGDTWFNVRYGIMLAPTIAIFGGYLLDRIGALKWTVIGLAMFTLLFAFANYDAVTIDDATVGSSQKNVTEVSGWLAQNTTHREGYVLISAASHDAIIFSSGLPMKRFIHEGTGAYWDSALEAPDRWAKWIIMRTHDDNDSVWRDVSRSGALDRYNLVESYPFADIYELQTQYYETLNTTPVLGKQK